jgi:hypothetical protein
MNLTVWMIDKSTAPRRFGVKSKGLFAKKEAKSE